VVDGLKPGQRKILYCCFKRNLKKDIKVRTAAACRVINCVLTCRQWLMVRCVIRAGASP
jgi:hypothetical protein